MSSQLRPGLMFLTVMNIFLIGMLEYRIHKHKITWAADEPLCLDKGISCVWPVVGSDLVRTVIEDTVHYRVDDEPLTVQEWGALVPGNGVIRFGKNDRTFTVSMFHQLRCLDILRASTVERFRTHSFDALDGEGNRSWESDLTNHCLNYLRQVTLCNGDLHLDPLIGDSGGELPLNRDHVCRDWTSVYRELKRNQEQYTGR